MLSGGIWAFAGRATTIPTVFVINVLLTRLLSPQDMGTYFLAFSVMTVGATAGVLGLNQAVIRLVAESLGLDQTGRARRVIHVVLVLGVLGASSTGLVYLLFGGALGRHVFHAPTLVAVNGLVAGWIVVMSLQMLLGEIFRGFHDIRLATVFGGVLAGIVLVVSLVLLLWVKGQISLSIAILLAVGSSAVSVLMAGWMLYRKMASLLPRGARNQLGSGEVLRLAWPMLVINLALVSLTQTDLWVLGAFRPQDEVALYGAATRMILLVSMPLMIVNAVVQPLIAQMYAQQRQLELERVLRTTATLAAFPAFLVMTAFILEGGSILALLFGDYYRAGATILSLLSAGQFVSVCVGSCGHTLLMTGHQMALMSITVVGGIVTVIVEVIAASHYGAVGVAGAAFGGVVIQSVSIWVAAKRKTGIWTHVGFTGIPNLLKNVRVRP